MKENRAMENTVQSKNDAPCIPCTIMHEYLLEFK